MHYAPKPSRLLAGVATLLVLAFAGARFPGPFAMLDNLSNFPAHFAAAFAACAALFAWRRRFIPALACAALAALALVPVVPWYVGAESAPDDPSRPHVRLLVSNVYYANRRHKRLLELVELESPDVVGLVEVNARWLRKLKPLRARYPYHYEVPDEHFVGLALYSRLPLEHARVLPLPGEQSTPAIAATLKTPRRRRRDRARTSDVAGRRGIHPAAECADRRARAPRERGSDSAGTRGRPQPHDVE